MNTFTRVWRVLLVAMAVIGASCSKQPEQAELAKEDSVESKGPTPTQRESVPIAAATPTMPMPPSSPGDKRDELRVKTRNEAVSEMKQRAPNMRTIDGASTTLSQYWVEEMNEPPTTLFPNKSMAQILEALVSPERKDIRSILEASDNVFAVNPDARKAVLVQSALYAVLFGEKGDDGASLAADLPNILPEGRGASPATAGDVLTYMMIDDAVRALDLSSPISDEKIIAWESLAQASNPVYRLIALNVFGRFSATPEQGKAFYSKYLSETEPGINRILADELAARGDDWASFMLRQVQTKIPQN